MIIKAGATTVNFSNNGTTLTHNCGFKSTDYVILVQSCSNATMIARNVINIDGNATKITGFSNSGYTLTEINGNYDISWIAISHT